MHLLHVVNFLGVPGDDCVDVDEDRRDRRERVVQLPGQSSTSSVNFPKARRRIEVDKPRKKVLLLMAGPLRGFVKGGPLRKKKLF